MGNCSGLQRPVTWVDDEEDGWGVTESLLSVKLQEEEAASRNAKKKVERSTDVRIRIRISKKQLEELLHQADVQGLPLCRVLAGLVGKPVRLEEMEKHWRPKLLTIPEVAELAY
ncbi:uncharacterized protein LOC122000390 [Zingiber officinale]|uniref:uncharacterized protein LOC122000390 n=1 Tax=Zingiber officinale TaxID=94328 RepID=UPI001C4D6C85|nr:uncharacterized protein LOC122000390 [Zingiber officinale]